MKKKSWFVSIELTSKVIPSLCFSESCRAGQDMRITNKKKDCHKFKRKKNNDPKLLTYSRVFVYN